jgi:hypothetical protein
MIVAYLYCLPLSQGEITNVALFSGISAIASIGIVVATKFIDKVTVEDRIGTKISLLVGGVAIIIVSIDILMLILQRDFTNTSMLLAEMICIYSAYVTKKKQ